MRDNTRTLQGHQQKVALTISDLDGSSNVQQPHIAESVGYRPHPH
ncbi:MAG: hypothetical protein ACI4A7_05365 [Prevotella sp.]